MWEHNGRYVSIVDLTAPYREDPRSKINIETRKILRKSYSPAIWEWIELPSAKHNRWGVPERCEMKLECIHKAKRHLLTSNE